MAEIFSEDDDIIVSDNENKELYERHRFVADKGQGMLRIDKYLSNLLGNDISRTRIQEAADAGFIRVNDNIVKSNYKIKPYDITTISLETPPKDFTIHGEDIPLNIAYEDDQLMVINKAAGMCVHPALGNDDGTLLNALAWYLKDSPNFDANNPRIGLCHRIDKDTSGLILIAKTEHAKTFLCRQFEEKSTERTYNALVWGVVKDDYGTISGSIARDSRERQRFMVYPEGENPKAKHAVTHYKVLKRFAYVTLVECKLETGRMHQIRVHFKHIGHPLFSDSKYGGAEIVKGNLFAKYKQFVANCFELCPRQALHAKTLGFIHPKTNEFMQFDSDLPQDFKNLLEKWEKYSPNNDE
ncbi:MAG: RluA family pseudouridine synthase [Prevotellaceae bacterium]|jgi:23S rRNA pseudouridine1911/1915/1917 synthase|nr:RluA family pseudouridine synthase [Prevotellaceae bacterium]